MLLMAKKKNAGIPFSQEPRGDKPVNYRRKQPPSALLGAACIAFCLLLAAGAQAEPIPMADGTMWKASSRVEKTAYIVGVNNFMTVEIISQDQSGNPPTEEQSVARRFWDSSDGVSLDQCIDAIDSWYEAHPDQLSVPVMVVIWKVFVEKE